MWLYHGHLHVKEEGLCMLTYTLADEFSKQLMSGKMTQYSFNDGLATENHCTRLLELIKFTPPYI